MRMPLGPAECVIENVPGSAGCNTVVKPSCRARGDGYTLTLMAPGRPHVVNGAIVRNKPPFHTHCGCLCAGSTDGNRPAAYSSQGKKRAGRETIREIASPGSCDASGQTHVLGFSGPWQRLRNVLAVSLSKGTEPLAVRALSGCAAVEMQGLIGGKSENPPLILTPAVSSLPHLQAGSIKAYAVTCQKRLQRRRTCSAVDDRGDCLGVYISPWAGALSSPEHAEATSSAS